MSTVPVIFFSLFSAVVVSSFKEAYDRQMQVLYFEIHDKVHLASSVKDFKKKKRGEKILLV